MKRKYDKIIKRIAKQEGVSPEYIYYQMQQAIEAGYNNPDPEVQAYWRNIAPNGEVLAPEELIGLMVKEIKK